MSLLGLSLIVQSKQLRVFRCNVHVFVLGRMFCLVAGWSGRAGVHDEAQWTNQSITYFSCQPPHAIAAIPRQAQKITQASQQIKSVQPSCSGTKMEVTSIWEMRGLKLR